MKNLLFAISAACCVCVAGARVVDGNLALNVQDGDVQTFDEDLLFQGWSRVFTIPAGVTAVFNGNLAMATPEGNSVFVGGAGTKVIRGGIRMDADTNADNDANAKAPRFQGGEWILESDLDLARYVIGGVSEADVAHVVVTNGAKIRNWGAGKNSFIQSCTIDLRGGRFVNDSNLIFAQDVYSHAHVHIFRDGLFDTGTTSFRCGNNGFAEFTVEAGGTLFWRQGGFSENGHTTLTVNGGRVVRGNNGQDGFGLGQLPANDSSYQNKGGNVLNLNGGELWTGSLLNNSNAARNKNTKTVVNLNGGTIMCGTETTFWGGVLDDLEVNVLEGGARVDTRGLKVAWNVGGMGPGGFAKLGVGTLTASAKLGFDGPVSVWAGTFAATDPSFVTQKVVLAPGGVFEPRGAASLAGLSASDGVLRLRCAAGTPALTLAAAPSVGGTLFFELQDAAGASLVTHGTYPLLAGPGLDDALAAKCRARNPAANLSYSFTVAEGVLSVTVAEGETPGTGSVSGNWTAAAGGSWQNAANWSAGVPGGLDAEAVLGANGAGPVSLDADATVAKLTIDSAAPYVLCGDGTLHFASSSGYTGINVNQGTHEIAAAVSADAPLRVSGGGTAVFTGSLDGAKDIQVISGKVASDNLSTLPKFLLAGGSFTYTGAGAGVAEGELRQTGNGDIYQAAGAGPMTLKLAPYLSSPSTLRMWGNGTEEIVFDGTGWITQPRDGRRLWLDGGIYRFAPGLRMVWEYGGDCMTRIGGTGNDKPVVLQIDDGARMRWKDTYIGGESDRGSDVSVVQNGGVVELSGDLSLNRVAATNALTYMKNGGVLKGGAWINFMYGPASFRQTAGETSFNGLAFGLKNNAVSANYVKYEMGGRGLMDVAGGTFTVKSDLNWLGDTGGRRVDRIRVSGDAELTIPATKRTVAYDPQRPSGFSTLELAGGTLKLNGAVSAGSADDYLAGLNFLSLSGEAAIDSATDATVTQPLRVASDVAGLTKKGAGALTLAAAANDLPAKVSVEAGTLAAAFRADAKANVPDGLLAYWTFDGEDPLKDATGHGYDLVQAVDGVDVQFSEEKAHAGKSAWWRDTGAALKCTAMTSAGLHRATISLWVRLESKDYYKSHIGMISLRNNLAATGHATLFDLAYKGAISSSIPEPGIGNCFFGSPLTGIPRSKGGDISVQEWHMLTVTRDGGRIRSYVDGAFCTEVNLPANIGATLLDAGRMITLGANICDKGAFSEMMNKDGRLDDVAIYSRCLEDADVAALYAAQCRPSAADEVRVAQDATLDLRGSSVATKLLGGAGTVVNGTVTVAESLAVDPVAPMTVDALVLGEAGAVDCGRTADDPLPTKGTFVLVQANSVTGAAPSGWTVTGTGWEKGRGRARLALNETNDLVLELVGSGTTIIFR